MDKINNLLEAISDIFPDSVVPTRDDYYRKKKTLRHIFRGADRTKGNFLLAVNRILRAIDKKRWEVIKDDIKNDLKSNFDFSEKAIEKYYNTWFKDWKGQGLILHKSDMPIDLENLKVMMKELKGNNEKTS